MSNNPSKMLGSSGVRALASALADNTCVTCVDIRGNILGSSELALLLPPLSRLPLLTALDLSYTGITASDACHVIATLAEAAVQRGGGVCSSLPMEGNGFLPEDVVAWSSRDLRLPQPHASVVKRGLGAVVEWLAGAGWVWGLGFGVWGLGFVAWGLGFGFD